MKRAVVAATGGVLALALGWSAPAGAWGPAAATAAKRIEDFVPRRLAGAELTQSSAPDRTVGWYLLPAAAEGGTRHVAVTLVPGPDAIEVRDATVVLKPGKTIDFAGYAYEGLRLDGRFVQRACGLDGRECQIDVMLAKRLLVSLRVERPTDRDEPLRLLAQIDIKGLEAFARKQPVSRVARSPDPAADRLHKEEAKLVEIWRAEQRAWLKAVGTPSSGPAANRTWTVPPAAAESLTGEQIQRGLGARSLGVRACYELAAEENARLSGGEITVSFTVEPSGAIANPKIEASTVADPNVESCVLRQLQKTSFPAARDATSARHTFAFSSASMLRPAHSAPAALPAQ
jgi:hypothetical protein